MRGIVKYVNKKTMYPVKYMISMDIDRDREEFEKRKQDVENPRSRYMKDIEIEIVEITDNPNEVFADYVLPKTERIYYDQSVKDAIAGGMKLKRIIRAIDWSVEHFGSFDFSFEFFVDSQEDNPKITVLVLQNNKKFEQYEFHGGKEPYSRTVY